MGGPLPSSPGDLKGREGKRPEGPGVPRNPSPGDVRGDGEGDTGGGTGGPRRSRRAPRTPAGSPRAPVGSTGGPQGSREKSRAPGGSHGSPWEPLGPRGPGAPGPEPRGLLGPSRPHGSRDTSREGLGCLGVRGLFLHAPGGPPGLLGPSGDGGGGQLQRYIIKFQENISDTIISLLDNRPSQA